VAAKLDFRMALRALARDRSRVLVQVRGGGMLAGVVGRVGADFLDLFDPEGGGSRPAAPRVRPDRSTGTLTVSDQNVVVLRRL
jgi:hypothetical protein